MAYLPNNNTYYFPLSHLIEVIQGFYETRVSQVYGYMYQQTTAYEDICWWVMSANQGNIDIESYAERTPFSNPEHDDKLVKLHELRYEQLETLDHYISSFLYRVVPNLDSPCNPEMKYTIYHDYFFIYDGRKHVFIPDDIHRSLPILPTPASFPLDEEDQASYT